MSYLHVKKRLSVGDFIILYGSDANVLQAKYFWNIPDIDYYYSNYMQYRMYSFSLQMEFATLLYEHGFLVTGGPLERIYESDDDDDESLCSGSDEKHS